jgi:Icc protein
MTTLLAQLTDLHIREPGRLAYGRLDTAPYLRAAVQADGASCARRRTPMVLTGDLTDFGRAAEYEHLASLLAPLRDAAVPAARQPRRPRPDAAQLCRTTPTWADRATPVPAVQRGAWIAPQAACAW